MNNLLKSKKAFIHHPIFLGFILGLIIGLLVMYLVAKGTIPLGLHICPVK